jgi:gliotoxin/aspirochlorine/mycotoxins biosynthesis cytochrome P450 monooxygenase
MPDDVKTVFMDSDIHLKGVNNDSGWLMGEILGKCVGLVTGAEWQRVRASTGDSFSHKSVSTNIKTIMDLTDAHFKTLHASGKPSKGVLNPAKDLRLLPFRIMANYLYGPITPKLLNQIEALIPLRESLFNQVIKGGISRFSWSQYLPSKINRNLIKFKSKWGEFNDVVYESYQLSKKPTSFQQMYESMKTGSTNRVHLLHTLDEMLFGNLDVTIGGISWNPLFLAANQDLQDQLREEIQHTSWSSRQQCELVAREKYIQKSDTLLAAAILESARLKPLAAFSIPQATPTERVVAGFRVPAGINFIIDTSMLNIHNPFWGDDSKEYRPSRFMGQDQSKLRYQYWRFGFGPRQCLEKYVADIMLRVLVVHLVENYQLSLASTSTWDKNPNVWITHPDTVIKYVKL